jgi:hypothetical protein
MNINFFEEFPNKKNLDKLKLIKFDSTLYVACKSLKKFTSIKKKITRINSKIQVGYWPILERSYWISSFSYTYELKKLYNELLQNKQNKPFKILIDLELPFLNKKLFFLNLPFFIKNKRLIKKIFKDSKKLNLDILTAEYPTHSRWIQKRLEFLGVSYPLNKYSHKKLIMFYTSTIKNNSAENKIKNYIKTKSKKWKGRLNIGLGTIATGILGDEPILSPKKLDEDLDFCKKQRMNTVMIFRLGGLNKEYIKVIKKYL